MTPQLRAGYWPNGPTFAMPKDWSDAVLSEGVEFGKQRTKKQKLQNGE